MEENEGEKVIILQEGKEIIRTFNGYYRRQSMKILTIRANLQKGPYDRRVRSSFSMKNFYFSAFS